MAQYKGYFLKNKFLIDKNDLKDNSGRKFLLVCLLSLFINLKFLIMDSISRALLSIKAVKLSPDAPFTWASGWKSPIYCNNRKLLAYPLKRRIVASRLISLVKEFGDNIDVILGVATGAISWGTLVADELNLPCGYIRSEKKDHGLKVQIEGFEPNQLKGKRVVIVEDLISTGGSSLKAVEAARGAGAEIVGMAAIFTYGFPQATEAFAKAGVELKTAANYASLLEAALDVGLVKESDLPWLSEWRESPETWGQHQN